MFRIHIVFFLIIHIFLIPSDSQCIILGTQVLPISSSTCPLGQLCGYVEKSADKILSTVKNGIQNLTITISANQTKTILTTLEQEISTWNNIYYSSCPTTGLSRRLLEEGGEGHAGGEGDTASSPGHGESGYTNGEDYVDSNGKAITSRDPGTGNAVMFIIWRGYVYNVNHADTCYVQTVASIIQETYNELNAILTTINYLLLNNFSANQSNHIGIGTVNPKHLLEVFQIILSETTTMCSNAMVRNDWNPWYFCYLVIIVQLLFVS